ncbi:signal peptidase I [Candidatus Williamhamiltonella defendens]|uniref:Signal peptidase I n=1 Tax=Candidatus Williamhamiltonella defendens TaxID=138072 RepID=A0A2D3TGG9_9ENTR|nr:signal peptidase I [Candidatus Hamiltonella defensa]ATW34774.1 signal peptidase I [Candidatus Hamiltonella defensa]
MRFSLKKYFVKKESWKRFSVKAVVTLLVLWAAGVAFASRYRIGIDPQQGKCLPGYTFFLIDLKDPSLERGAVYAFHAKNMPPFYKDGTRMVKILTGMPGDKVEINDKLKITVNGDVVGEGLQLAGNLNLPESHFYGKATLKDGHYWFMGKSSFSFDSRYWGTVKDDQIIGRAYPLF